MSLESPRDADEQAFWDAAYCAALASIACTLDKTPAGQWETADLCSAHASFALERRRAVKG